MNFIRGAWKAVAAFAMPIVTGIAVEWLSDLQTALPGLASGVVTALFVYMTKNTGPKAPVSS